MEKLQFDYQAAQQFLPQDFLTQMEPELQTAHQKILSGTGSGHEFLGWVNLPETYDRAEFERLQIAASEIKSHSQVVVVIGIGGSYLGARAALEALRSPFYNQLPKTTPEIYFAGNNLSAEAFLNLKSVIGARDFSLIVISKSGTTTEPAVAFRLFRQLLIQKYGAENANQRIYAITDKNKGVLKQMAIAFHYHTFDIPDDIGGRYSVLTPVGLLPLATAGIDLFQLLAGAQTAQKDLTANSLANPAWQYAAARQTLYRAGMSTEIFATYEPSLQLFSEWWKQLFGESEGKNQQGLFPASVQFTTDLHSLGQFIQSGRRNLLETTLWLAHAPASLIVPDEPTDIDQLNFLSHQDLNFINQQAFRATVAAHTSGGVPNLIITLPEMNPWQLGYLFYFFEFSCALSAYLAGVNPFDQPGVEVYKKKMFQLLGKK